MITFASTVFHGHATDMNVHPTYESSDGAIAGIAPSLAFLFSVPVFLSGRVMPATWLLPLVLFILWFFTFYDWSGLIDSAKPRYDVLDHTWQFFR